MWWNSVKERCLDKNKRTVFEILHNKLNPENTHLVFIIHPGEIIDRNEKETKMILSSKLRQSKFSIEVQQHLMAGSECIVFHRDSSFEFNAFKEGYEVDSISTSYAEAIDDASNHGTVIWGESPKHISDWIIEHLSARTVQKITLIGDWCDSFSNIPNIIFANIKKHHPNIILNISEQSLRNL